MEIRIDPELQRLIPPLTSEEYSQLETNLLADGCRDPLVVWKRNDETILLDGHNRLKICEAHGLDYAVVEETLPDIESAKNWMDANQLGRRNLTLELMRLLRGRRYEREKKAPHDGGKGKERSEDQNDPHLTTAQKLADEYGVSEATIKRDGKFAEECSKDPELEKLVMQRGNVKKYKKDKQREERAKAECIAITKISNQVKKDSKKVFSIHCCDFSELLKNETPDCIITDPPYEAKYIPEYERLAECSKNIQLIAVMCGQTYLPEIYDAMCKHLRYRWTIAYLTPGGQAVQQFPAKVNTFWKPVLLFGDAVNWIGDVCKSDVNDNEKQHHEWGQSVSGMVSLVKALTQPNQLICDPFCGAGTTGIAAIKLGRRFVGCDVNETHVNTARDRCLGAFADNG